MSGYSKKNSSLIQNDLETTEKSGASGVIKSKVTLSLYRRDGKHPCLLSVILMHSNYHFLSYSNNSSFSVIFFLVVPPTDVIISEWASNSFECVTEANPDANFTWKR